MRSGSLAVVLCTVLLGAAPASRPAPDPQTTGISRAIADLSKEFDAFLRNPEKQVRTESDYFKQNPSADVTPDGILKVLERPAGGDPRLEAYVKWQLLSAVPAAFEEKLVQRAGNAYLRAPPPMTRPGVTVADQQALMKDLQANRSKLDEVNERYKNQIEQFERAHEPVLKYRTLLMARLPVSGQTLAAGFDDVAQRVAAGVEYDKFLDALLGSARNWLLDGKATPAQLAAMSQVIDRVKSTKPPTYYDKAAINSKGAPYWKTRTAPGADAGDRLSAFQTALREAAASKSQASK